MAGTRRFVKVFLASPGDLTEERKAAKVIVEDFNSQLADALGYQVELVGWEDTLPGIGRPQAIINRDLDGCDLFVGMLWKRWGTPPGTEPYTSGFEEEFKRSMHRNTLENRPQINLLLKDLDPATLADPGDQLKRVIAFKEDVFAEKKLLAWTFGDIRDFEGKFRKCIQGYVIALANDDKASVAENDQAPAAEVPNLPSNEPKTTTPLSLQGAKFLRSFLVSAEKASDENPLAAEDIARVRLLSIIAAVHGNDQQALGSHDANLLFKARSKFDFGRRELNGLLDESLAHFKNQNAPLWHWVASVDGFKNRILPISTVIGPPDLRVGALKAMRLISEPIIEEENFGRKFIVPLWFSKESDASIRIAALEYLSDFGQQADLDFINQEVAKNDSQTTIAAADAIIRIKLRDDRREALQALYELEPSTVKKDLVLELFGPETEFDNEELKRGLSHRNGLVRATAAKLLKDRQALSVSTLELLLNDDVAEIRFTALKALEDSGQRFSVKQARAILVRSKTSVTGFSLLTMGQKDFEGEATFERFVEHFYDSQSLAQLEEEADTDIFEQNAYFALLRRDFKVRGDDLRKAVSNHFVERFEFLLQEMAGQFAASNELIERTRLLGPHLRDMFTRAGLTIICSRGKQADLSLVRRILLSEKLSYSPVDLNYLAKYGQWCDIPLIIDLLNRPEHGRTSISILSISSSTKYFDAARAIYSLGRHRLGDLLEIKMPSNLLAQLIPLISDRDFQKLTQGVILQLMRSENEEIRKFAALKYVRTFSRRQVKELLEEYMAADQYYYNVIHWLDFGISVPRERMLRAAGKLLSTS